MQNIIPYGNFIFENLNNRDKNLYDIAADYIIGKERNFHPQYKEKIKKMHSDLINQLEIGKKIEKDKGSTEDEAIKIALDNLSSDPNYYSN